MVKVDPKNVQVTDTVSIPDRTLIIISIAFGSTDIIVNSVVYRVNVKDDVNSVLGDTNTDADTTLDVDEVVPTTK